MLFGNSLSENQPNDCTGCNSKYNSDNAHTRNGLCARVGKIRVIAVNCRKICITGICVCTRAVTAGRILTAAGIRAGFIRIRAGSGIAAFICKCYGNRYICWIIIFAVRRSNVCAADSVIIRGLACRRGNRSTVYGKRIDRISLVGSYGKGLGIRLLQLNRAARADRSCRAVPEAEEDFHRCPRHNCRHPLSEDRTF